MNGFWSIYWFTERAKKGIDGFETGSLSVDENVIIWENK